MNRNPLVACEIISTLDSKISERERIRDFFPILNRRVPISGSINPQGYELKTFIFSGSRVRGMRQFFLDEFPWRHLLDFRDSTADKVWTPLPVFNYQFNKGFIFLSEYRFRNWSRFGHPLQSVAAILLFSISLTWCSIHEIRSSLTWFLIVSVHEKAWRVVHQEQLRSTVLHANCSI